MAKTAKKRAKQTKPPRAVKKAVSGKTSLPPLEAVLREE